MGRVGEQADVPEAVVRVAPAGVPPMVAIDDEARAESTRRFTARAFPVQTRLTVNPRARQVSPIDSVDWTKGRSSRPSSSWSWKCDASRIRSMPGVAGFASSA